MLALGIRYLNGFVAASEPDNLDRAEWPPHPGRVFMALAAAHFHSGADPGERKALLWLEALEKDGEPAAPHIVASGALQRDVVTHYVPVNDKAGPSKSLLQTVPLTRNRQPRTFARSWLEDDTAYLVWPDIDPDESVRAALAGLCGKVTRIGHSTSLVQMWLAGEDEAGEPNWLPDEERAVIRLRLAPPGTLEYLERRFNGRAVEAFAELRVMAMDAEDKEAQKVARRRLREEFPEGPPPQLRPNLSAYRGYAPPAEPDTNFQAAGVVFSPHLIVLRLERERGPYGHLDLACVLHVASRWREALLSQSDDLSGSVNKILSGHDVDGVPLEDPHLAFVPLAFVGHEYADGRLLGMGVALPRDVSPDDRRGVLTVLGRVRRLKLGRLGVWRLETVTADQPPWNLRPATWTGYPRGVARWSTVTPVAFDRHPKTKDKGASREEVADMIGRCCVHVGLPPPREVIVTAVSAHLGTSPAHAFPRLHRKDGSPRRHTHGILVFDEPVCGPILLGAGRYRGYGLCRPLDEQRQQGG